MKSRSPCPILCLAWELESHRLIGFDHPFEAILASLPFCPEKSKAQQVKETQFHRKSPGLGVSRSILESYFWHCLVVWPAANPSPFLGFHVPVGEWVDWTTLPLMYSEHWHFTLCSGPTTKLQASRERLERKEIEWGLRSEAVNGRRFPTMYSGPIGVTSPCLFRWRIHSFVHSVNSIYGATGAIGSEFECYEFWMMTLLVALDLSQKLKFKPWLCLLVVMWGCEVISAPWDSDSYKMGIISPTSEWLRGFTEI